MSEHKKSILEKNRKWLNFGSMDMVFFFSFLIILLIGVVMMFSASYPSAHRDPDCEYDSMYYLKKQMSGIALGSVAMWVFSRYNYKRLAKAAAVFGTVGTIGLLILAFFMREYHGTHRYVYLGPIQLQPSDVAKFTIILTLAYILDEYHNLVVSKTPLQNKAAKAINSAVGRPLLNNSILPIVGCGLLILIDAALIYKGSHLSGMILVLAIGVVCLALGEIRGKWFIFGILAGAVILFAAYKAGLLKDYMETRIYAWRHKDFEPLGARWQTNQALYAIGSGGFFGKGLGQSMQKFLYVSEPQNDMIFSIVVEELGFIGAVGIFLLFAVLIWRGVVIGVNADSRYGSIVAIAIVFQIGLQVFLNVMVATDGLPNTGISLPFFSYGRTSMILNMAEVGMVLNISRNSKIKKY